MTYETMNVMFQFRTFIVTLFLAVVAMIALVANKVKLHSVVGLFPLKVS
nr:putative holin-like toxin [Alkalihalobacillus sp. BA299]